MNLEFHDPGRHSGSRGNDFAYRDTRKDFSSALEPTRLASRITSPLTPKRAVSMSTRKIVKTVALCAGSLALSSTATLAFAHTSIADQVTEGKNIYTNIVIGHGCEDAHEKAWAVTAQSVVLPTVNPVITGGTVQTYTETGLDNKDGDGTVENDDFSVADPDVAVTVKGMVDLVQSKDIFLRQDEKYDGNGNTIGFHASNGKLQPNLRGLVPFRASASKVKFNPNKCAKSLKILVAVADICKRNFPPQVGTGNLWMPNLSGEIIVKGQPDLVNGNPNPNRPADDPNDIPSVDGAGTSTHFTNIDIDGLGAPATLTVNRDTTASPYPASCDGSGGTAEENSDEVDTRFDVTITPSAEDVDANLPFQFWRR